MSVRLSTQLNRPRPKSLDELVAERVEEVLRDVVERVTVAVEERARALTTHLTVAEAATSLRISETFCRQMIDDGVVPAIRLGHRVVVPRAALEQLGVPDRSPPG